MAGAVWAEDEIGRKWDRCFTDAILKLGGGLALGGVFSLFFFKSKMHHLGIRCVKEVAHYNRCRLWTRYGIFQL
ncbi:MICOS complex subunit MIC10 isoform X2 [Pogonomyrmex barbatus]|uniref:MICOS complex subunit MIC10 n=1 Tax=Pogonomyrmex barbatus TaxID=144034 RepID=A0A6I9WRE7_9HYME|nr:MICOS complex subunit MIC10 isoform X2 [Pogonomyrmex barbatus]